MRCPKCDSSFPNTDYIYCPYCRKKLQKSGEEAPQRTSARQESVDLYYTYGEPQKNRKTGAIFACMAVVCVCASLLSFIIGMRFADQNTNADVPPETTTRVTETTTEPNSEADIGESTEGSSENTGTEGATA